MAPAQLEAILMTHPSVVDCAVVARPHVRLGEVPVVFVVKSGEDLDGLLPFINEQVPRYMRVAEVIEVEEIPHSPTGKVLRRVLAGRLVRDEL